MNLPGEQIGESWDGEKLDALRAAIREGLESGPAEPWDLEEIKRMARAGRATQKGDAPDV